MAWINSYKGYECTLKTIPASGSPTRTIVYARDVTLNRSTDEADATSRYAEGWSNPAPGLRNWSVDFDIVLMNTDTAYDHLISAWKSGAYLFAYLTVPNSSGGVREGNYGTAFISDLTRSEPVGDSVTVSVSLTGMGPLT